MRTIGNAQGRIGYNAEGLDKATQRKNIFRIPQQQARWLKNGSRVYVYSASISTKHFLKA
ncbi:MAG: hypothetical protein V4450_01335 [Bacteroidota bacterium]